MSHSDWFQLLILPTTDVPYRMCFRCFRKESYYIVFDHCATGDLHRKRGRNKTFLHVFLNNLEWNLCLQTKRVYHKLVSSKSGATAMHKMGYRTEMRDLKPDQRTLTRICVNVCRGCAIRTLIILYLWEKRVKMVINPIFNVWDLSLNYTFCCDINFVIGGCLLRLCRDVPPISCPHVHFAMTSHGIGPPNGLQKAVQTEVPRCPQLFT